MPMIANWKLVVFERYAKFDGRAGRAEFWWFVLALVIVHFILAFLAAFSNVFVFVAVIWVLATIVPFVAAGIRRLHDTNKTGWFILIQFIPFIGWIIMLFFWVPQGDEGANQYGASAEPAAS